MCEDEQSIKDPMIIMSFHIINYKTQSKDQYSSMT